MMTYVFTLPPFFEKRAGLKWAIPLLHARAILMASCENNAQAQAYVPINIWESSNFRDLSEVWKNIGINVSVVHDIPEVGEIFPYSFDRRTLEACSLFGRVNPGADINKGNLYDTPRLGNRDRGSGNRIVFDIPKPRGRLALLRRQFILAEYELRKEGVKKFVCAPQDGASGFGIYSSLSPTLLGPKIPKRGTIIMENLQIASGGFLGEEKSISCQYLNGHMLGATWQLLEGKKWCGNIFCSPDEIPDLVKEEMKKYIQQLPPESRIAGGVDWIETKDGRLLALDLNLNRLTGAHPGYSLFKIFNSKKVWGQKMFKPKQTLKEFVKNNLKPIEDGLIVPIYWSDSKAMIYCLGDSVLDTYDRLTYF